MKVTSKGSGVKPGSTVVLVGDGAVGLLGVLSAKQMGYTSPMEKIKIEHHTVSGGAWLAAWPCCHVHFTPIYTSWLNQVER